MFPISSPFVHFQQGQFVFRGLTNVKLEPNRKEEECKLWKSNWKEIGWKDGCWDVNLRPNSNWKVEKRGRKDESIVESENWLESDVEKPTKLNNCWTQHKLIQASKKSVLPKKKGFKVETIIHPSSQSTGGLQKEVMWCWSNFRATLPSWWEYMHIMAYNIPQIHPLSHNYSNLGLFYQRCFVRLFIKSACLGIGLVRDNQLSADILVWVLKSFSNWTGLAMIRRSDGRFP